MSEAAEWPSHFGDCCPPDDAKDTAGELFYAAHQPPQPDDFRSAKERGAFKNDDDCERAALSLWSIRDRVEALTKLPNHRGKVVLRALLDASHGRMKQTRGPGHHSVWFRATWHAKLAEVLTP